MWQVWSVFQRRMFIFWLEILPTKHTYFLNWNVSVFSTYEIQKPATRLSESRICILMYFRILSYCVSSTRLSHSFEGQDIVSFFFFVLQKLCWAPQPGLAQAWALLHTAKGWAAQRNRSQKRSSSKLCCSDVTARKVCRKWTSRSSVLSAPRRRSSHRKARCMQLVLSSTDRNDLE